MISNKLFSILSRQSNLTKTNIKHAIRTNTSTASYTEPPRIEKTLNSVQLIGRVGRDPEKKGTTERPITVFSMATHTNYRYESGEFMQRTEWHRVVVFKPGLREIVLNYLKKGQRVFVTGKITYGEIKSEDGQIRSTTAVSADDVIFLQNTGSQETGTSA